MQLSVLHSFLGDKEIEFDPETEEGRKKLGETLTKLLRSGTAIFLERADKTYRVTGWDPQTDKLLVQAPGRWPSLAKGEVVEGEIVSSAPQLPAAKESGRKGKKHGPYRAGTRRGRMTAVAPTAGG